MVKGSDVASSRSIQAVALITALSLTGDSMLYIALPVYWREAGLDSLWQVGLLLSINRFVRLPLNPIVGWCYQKISLRMGLSFAIILGFVTTCGYGLIKGIIAWLVLRCLWGCAWSFLRIGGLSSVVHFSFQRHRGKMMGTYNGLYRLGSLVGMLLGGLFVPVVGLRTVSLVLGIAALCGLPLIVRFVPPISRSRAEEPKKQRGNMLILLRSFFSIQALLVMISGFFVIMLYQGIFVSTLSSAIEHFYGKELKVFGLLLTATFLSGLMQALRWGWEPFLAVGVGKWSDGARGRIPIYVVALFIAAVAISLLSMTQPIIVWIAIILVFMLSATAMTTLTDTLASDVARTKGENAVSFLTIYSIIEDLGAALGPFIAYLLIPLKSGFQSLYLGGALLFIMLAVLWLFQKKHGLSSKWVGKQSC
ncbi:MFS transporter [Pullulanibacillus camelliae]|uniref:MFS transporter n=1 Tax=Pullulanibacillus camelliae TaxID=1707096 RepID=A0A8J2VMB8_9BACL|nr:MFS transporter [Pullulanibacillus camelliae]GGE30107.1 MFS transporter [Pullulanibacillus camelliae]